MYKSQIGFIDKYEDKYNTNVDMNKILTEQKELIDKKEQEKIIQEKSVYYDKNESRLLSFQKENAIFKLSEQNTKVCYEEGFKNILFEMYIDSLALDIDFINENYKSINNFFMSKLNEFANNNISELIEKCSSSKPIKEISKACKKKARKKSDDAIQKANNASTVEEINDIFNDSMNDDNKPEKDDIGVDPEQIANDVKKKVIDVIKSEEEESEKKKEFLDDLKQSKDLGENSFLYKNDYIEHHSLFNSIMIGNYKDTMKTLKGLKESNKDYYGNYGSINENGSIKINMDYILADTILEYTRLELYNTLDMINMNTKQLQELADHYAYHNK